MPIVEISIFEGRDEETKAKIARDVADAVAEHTRNSIADVHVIFNEVPRNAWWRGLVRTGLAKPSTSPVRADYASMSRIKYDPAREAEYLALRQSMIAPGLTAQEGFVSSLLLRPHDRENEYLLILKWLSEKHWKTFETTSTHARLKEQALKILPKPLETVGADIVHVDPQ